jgi:hypothetical protein
MKTGESMFFDPGGYIQENNCANDRRDEGSPMKPVLDSPTWPKMKPPITAPITPTIIFSYDSESSSAASDMTAAKPVIMPTISQL